MKADRGGKGEGRGEKKNLGFVQTKEMNLGFLHSLNHAGPPPAVLWCVHWPQLLVIFKAS